MRRTVKTAVAALRRYACFIVAASTLTLSVEVGAAPASPAINTTAGNSGAKLTDTAVLSGGFNPTGTITFRLDSPGSIFVYTDVVTVAGDGTYTTATGNNPGGYQPAPPGGTYLWTATYSGDSNNIGVTDNGQNESSEVSFPTPGITSQAGGTVILGSGSKLTDTATLLGGFNPTGTITFDLFNSSNVSVYVDTVTINGNGSYSTSMGNNAGGFLPTVAGTYLWEATYSGDANNNGSTDDGTNESQSVIGTTLSLPRLLFSASASPDSVSRGGAGCTNP